MRALALLRAEAPCKVVAVFARSFYLQSADAMACLGGPEIGTGPLNAQIETPLGMDWPASGLRPGAQCRRGAGTLYLANRFALSWHGAATWRPAPWPTRIVPAALARALSHLESEWTQLAPAEGLARPALGLPGHRRAGIALAARAPLAESRRWFAGVLGCAGGEQGIGDLAWVKDLAGLGPGLTPSGDDFLGGVTIALHALGYAGAARRLAGAAASAAAANGNAISAAHLDAAGEGQGCGAIHDVLHGLLHGDDTRLHANLMAIGRIGHSSGWDILAGLVAVLRVWRAQQDLHRQAA